MKKTEYKVAPVATFESVDAFCAGSSEAYYTNEHVVEPLKEKDSCSLWTVLCRLFTISSTGDRAPNRETFDRAPLHMSQNRRTFDRRPLLLFTPDKLK